MSSFEPKTNENISVFLPEPLKWVKSWKQWVIIMLISDYLSSNIMICSLFWFDLFSRGRAEIQKYFRSFLVQMKTSKSHSEINWPLKGYFEINWPLFEQFIIIRGRLHFEIFSSSTHTRTQSRNVLCWRWGNQLSPWFLNF